jgi:hypothetical protein
MLISRNGIVNRQRVAEIRVIGRPRRACASWRSTRATCSWMSPRVPAGGRAGNGDSNAPVPTPMTGRCLRRPATRRTTATIRGADEAERLGAREGDVRPMRMRTDETTMQLSDLVGAAAIEDAIAELQGVIVRTPLLPRRGWRRRRREVRLKCENLQRAGAFKIRGAYTAIARLSGCGWAGRDRVLVRQPRAGRGAGGAAVRRARGGRHADDGAGREGGGRARLGAEVVLEGTTSVERQQRAEAIAAEQGLTIMPAFDHRTSSRGRARSALEILEDWPDVEVIVVPIGGGGLISGIAAWVKQTRPRDPRDRRRAARTRTR